ncbi:MAG: toxin-antitoxin system YwqK family antitoxin [Chloroflexi bacterium]|nr:toxin-antitoxin system YwqK family antitoxin [Chloroflexota bacterium]
MTQPGQAQHRNSATSSLPHGIVRSYDAQGWVLRSVSYHQGRRHGAELLFDAPGATLFTLPLSLSADLERGELTQDLRWFFVAQEIALAADALLLIVEPEREYLITQIGQSYTIRVTDGYLAVAPGRLLRATHVENNSVVSRTHYAGGRLEGERAIYAPPAEPLFTLALDFEAALDGGDIKQLQPAFRRHGYLLAADALVALDLAGSEWRIMQSARIFSVVHTSDCFTVYPGRIVQRAIFAAGQLVETVEYRAGQQDGTVTIYGPPGPELFRLDPALRAALDLGQLGALVPLFRQHGYALANDATLTTVLEGGEWLIQQIGQSYSIQRSADRLTVGRGRVLSRSRYRSGKLDGMTVLYDEQGRLAQQICYAEGQLHGPMTVYAAGVQQTLVTFERGKKHGQMIAYDAQGRPTMISEYERDLLDGELRLYKDGSLQAVVTYRGGVQHGRSTAYHPSGQESLVASYANNLLDGESMLYTETGQLAKTSQYREGRLEGAVIEYYLSGTVRTHATYHDDKLDGIAYLYDEQGRLQEKTHYRNGEPVGKPERRSWRQTLMQR